MKFNNFWTGAIIATVICLIAGYVSQVISIWPHAEEPIIEVKTDTLIKFIDHPVPVDSTIVRYITVKVPLPGDTVFYSDTVFAYKDSLSFTLPISQVQYKDSTYQAWVSGYQPALDSIKIFQTNTVITKTIPEIRYKTKRWGVGVQLGVGVTPSKIEPYLGVGVSYNVFAW